MDGKGNGMNRKRMAAGIFLLCLAVSAFNWSMEARRERMILQQQKREERAMESGMLNLQLDAEISTLDPQAAVDSASFEVIACMMEGLYRTGEDGLAELAAAERAECSEDGKRYRFLLKEAVWSDGRPVTAQDFVYGWQRGIAPENGNENAFLFQTAGIRNAGAILSGKMHADQLGIRAVDERTLEVELEKPCPYFLSMLSFPVFYPMNQEFYEQFGDQFGTSPETLLANGAFVMEAYQPSGQEIVLEKNSLYHEAEQVKLEGIHYQVVKDSQQAVMAYETGLLDMALLSGEQAESYRQSPEFQSLPLGSLWYISPNQKVDGLENEHLRKAFFYACDKETAVSQVMKDGSRAAYGAVPWKSAYGPDGKDFREGAQCYGQMDKERARTELEQAKAELGRQEFIFSLLIEDTEAAGNLGQFLQEEIRSTLPGVEIRLEPVPKKIRLERMAQGDYELGLSRWGADYSDPLAFLEMWTTDSPFNYGSWSDGEYDALIASVKEEALLLQPQKRWEVLHQGEALVMEHAVIFPICEKANGILLRSWVKGAQFHCSGVNRVWTRAVKERK